MDQQREAKSTDFKAWAETRLVKRSSNSEQALELNNNGKVYVLERTGTTALQVKGVIDEPSEELIKDLEPV